MAEVPRYVVDASAVLKWQFQQEQGSQQAVELVTDPVRGRVELLAPHHLPFEFSNVIWHRVLDGNLPRPAGRQMIADFLALRIPTFHPTGLTLVAYDFAFRYGLSFFDALYVGLAQVQQLPFLTGDDRMVRSPAQQLRLIRSIEDYRTERQAIPP